jgi:hypothetical protein
VSSIPQTYYVYILVRSTNGKAFYVGKGTGKRVYSHEEEARSKCHCKKCNTIRKVWRQGGQVLRYIVFTTNDEQEAYDYEREQIALYGRKNLCNHTDGGAGASGAFPSAESRAKNSASNKGKVQSPEAREKIRAALMGHPVAPETLAKQQAASKKRWSDPKARAAVAEMAKAMWSDPDYRARQSDLRKIQWSDPEHRAKQSVLRSDPEYRAKQSALRKAAWVRWREERGREAK